MCPSGKPNAALQFHQYLFIALWLASTVYGLVRGGGAERSVAMAQFMAALLTRFVTSGEAHATLYVSVEIGVFYVDAGLFAVVTLIALLSARFWPIPQASMIGCDLLGHLAKHLAPEILPNAYYVIVAIWGYPTVILLMVATWRHRARLARYGTDPDWLWQLPRRYGKGWSTETAIPAREPAFATPDIPPAAD
jgi:hypothetical protein